MKRNDLTDFGWSVIEPLLPRVDDRRVLNGIFWRFRTGSPWADIPERDGPHTTCYNRFVRWSYAGIWDKLLAAMTEACDDDIVMIDSLHVRVHKQGAAPKKRRRASPTTALWAAPEAG
jgi:transposase